MDHSYAMKRAFGFAVLISATVACLPAQAAERMETPLRFFEGQTEMVSMVNVIMGRSYHSQTLGQGQILPDGSLLLVQTIRDAGKPARMRRWTMRQVGPGHFTGSMSDAVGPVDAQEVGGNYRFRFKLKGGLAVEQWLAPVAGGRSAKSTVVVRKFGMKVATSTGTIRRL